MLATCLQACDPGWPGMREDHGRGTLLKVFSLLSLMEKDKNKLKKIKKKRKQARNLETLSWTDVPGSLLPLDSAWAFLSS